MRILRAVRRVADAGGVGNGKENAL
jgi:hypothetical protein